MPNPNYNRGRAKEYRIVKQLKEEGWPYVQRTAASHSEFDIIAIKPPCWVKALIPNGVNGKYNETLEDGEILLIQSKGGKTGERELKKLEKSGIQSVYSGTYQVTVRLE